eukprot:Phypoly_transcript_01897.p1 GENE.Phypoly_transcript_01897~~Phypoly_transcript_01897.p1  ORF type:complete len:1017 (+),score=204.66 Phypoly_transcript_01897:308-3052(+)
MAASLKDTEDADLKRAMQISIAAANGGPQPMDIDMNGQPKVSDEERAMAEAIEKSLEYGASAGINMNPASMKRDPGVPVGLKNVGNTCYVNSLIQTYFMLPALRNAILSFVPPSLPPAPASVPLPPSPQPPQDGTSPAPSTSTPTPMDATSSASSSAPPNSPEGSRRDDAQPAPKEAAQEIYKSSDQDAIEFIIELQRLFASLVLSTQRYVDPSHMLKKLKDKSGNTLKIGNQEDVVEFNDLFLDTIQRGLNLNRDPALAQVNANLDFIKNMFYGHSVQLISGKEEDSTPFEITSDSVFNHLILRVGKDLPDLFSSLDAHVCDTVDYTTEKGFKTKASSTTWFRKMPPILMFQQSRVGFDPEKKTFLKSLAPLNFDKEIFMDRYLVENKGETTRIRGIVNSWREELARHEDELRKFTHYEGDCGLDQAMVAMIRYYQGKSEGSNPYAQRIIDQLQADYQTESQKMRTLRDVIGNLRSQIATAYDHMKSTPYELYAVWVHQGVAGSGHYWAFLTDPRTGKWMRFNDMRVSNVVEEEVMTESVGGHANSSAYFLIYVEKTMLSQVTNTPDIFNYLPESLPISDSLKAEIAEANKKFQESLESAEKNSSETKVSKFVEKYKEKVADIEKRNKEQYPQDYRISTFWVFLLYQGHIEMVMADIVRQLYSVHFEKGIQMDIDSANYNGVKEHVGKEVIELALAMAVDTSKIDPLKQQHRIFQQSTLFLCNGLNLMLDDKYEVAVDFLMFALVRDAELENSRVRRTEEFKNFLRIFFLKTLERIKYLVANNQSQATTNLLAALNYSNMALGTSDPITAIISQELLRMGNTGTTYGDAFKFVGTILLSLTDSSLANYQKKPPPPATLSAEEETALLDRFVEVCTRVERMCTEPISLLTQLGLMQKREEIPSEPVNPPPAAST